MLYSAKLKSSAIVHSVNTFPSYRWLSAGLVGQNTRQKGSKARELAFSVLVPRPPAQHLDFFPKTF